MTTIPETTHTTVPVTCTSCGSDMIFSIKWLATDRRIWTLRCLCGREEDSGQQKCYQLWANDHTVYVGSYWGPDDGIETPSPEPLAREAAES